MPKKRLPGSPTHPYHKKHQAYRNEEGIHIIATKKKKEKEKKRLKQDGTKTRSNKNKNPGRTKFRATSQKLLLPRDKI